MINHQFTAYLPLESYVCRSPSGRQGDSHGHQDGHHLGPGETMGKPWEKHGKMEKILGKPWETHRKNG